MLRPLSVRSISETEKLTLEQGLRSKDALTLRRCQILPASAKGQRPSEIAKNLGCSAQTIRNALRAFEQEGLSCLVAPSTRPKTVQPTFDAAKRERLRSLLHANPRNLGKTRSTWTLELLAEVCEEQGITQGRVSRTTIEEALKAMNITWSRAKAWIVSPDEQYELKKLQRNRLIALSQQHPDWVLGFAELGVVESVA